jgi:aspartate/methionine/tyrosine aminotransferase
MREFSKRLEKIKPTIFSYITNLANEYKAINLGQGFPDFDGPEFIKTAAIQAIKEEGKNQYCPSIGIPELRTAIAEKYKKIYKAQFDPNSEITVYSGATEAIFSTLYALLNPEDEVILLEPFYDQYLALCYFTGAIPKFVRIAPNFSIDFEQLEAAVSPRTKCVIINNPQNPLGKMFSKQELERIGRICSECFIITDEVYEHITFENTHVSLASLSEFRDRAITISSTAKTFSLTGWKIGYTLANPQITESIRMVHQFVTFCTTTPLQYAMAEAVRAPLSYYENLKREYWKKRDLLNSILQNAGFRTFPPQGSYYIVADISNFNPKDDIQFCEYLIKEVGVAAIPMSVFYSETNPVTNLVRFCFAKKNPILEAAEARLKRL